MVCRLNKLYVHIEMNFAYSRPTVYANENTQLNKYTLSKIDSLSSNMKGNDMNYSRMKGLAGASNPPDGR